MPRTRAQVLDLSEDVSSLLAREKAAVAARGVLQSQLLEASTANLLLEQGKSETEEQAQRLQQQLEAVSAKLRRLCTTHGRLTAQLQQECDCRQKVRA